MLINRWRNWGINFPLAGLALFISSALVIVVLLWLNGRFGFRLVHPYFYSLLSGLLITNLVGICIITGLWDRIPRRSRFDQPNQIITNRQKSLQLRTLSAMAVITFLLLGGLVMLWTRYIPTEPETTTISELGTGGFGPFEMPQEIIERLNNTVQAYARFSSLPTEAKDDLIILSAALTEYQEKYTAETYDDWETINNLINEIEQVERKLPDIETQLQPELNYAKGSLIRYVSANEPYRVEPPAKLFDSLMWLWLLAVGGTSFVSVFLAYGSAQTYLKTTESDFTFDAEVFRTAVSSQLTNHPKHPFQHYLRLTYHHPRPDNSGYFFIFLCYDLPYEQDDSPIHCLIFTVGMTCQIEDPIFIVDILGFRENGSLITSPNIDSTLRSALYDNMKTKLSLEDFKRLFFGFELPFPTNYLTHEQIATILINELIQQGRVCDLLKTLQEISVKINWLIPPSP